MKVLLIEDEVYIARPVEQALKRNNYSVDLAFDGEYGLDCGLTNMYDIIVLDIMLPKMDGITVLRELQKSGVKTPVLLLTAKKQTRDRIYGLDSGADDYLVKPFDTDELLARIRALSRRRSEIDFGGILKFGDIELNPHTLILCRGGDNNRTNNTNSDSGNSASDRARNSASSNSASDRARNSDSGDSASDRARNSDSGDSASDRARNSAGSASKLTLKEAQLLELLIQRKNMITPKELIIEKLWGYDTDTEDSHVEYHVSLLRKKLMTMGASVSIVTVRGAGYTLSEGGG